MKVKKGHKPKMKYPKNTYLSQINDYYNRSLSSHVLIELGATPKYLVNYGVPELPLVMQQSTLTKCIRKNTGSRSAHNLPRNIIEQLPEQINHPIFLIQDKERSSIALICDAKDQNANNILIAIKLNEKRKEIQVNEIKSIYGKTSLKEYLYKHVGLNQLNVIDRKKAEILSRVLGLQLPTTLIASSYNKNIPSENKKVNKNFQKARQEDRKPDNNFQFLGKEKMIELMKSQFGYTADKATPEFEFKYTKLGDTSERLEYYNVYYDDHHDLYHSIVAGEEVCLYHINDGRNRRVEMPKNTAEPKTSVVDKLNRFSQGINSDKVKSQISRDNNLENQRTPYER